MGLVDRQASMSETLAAHGLVLRGGFSFEPTDVPPAGPSGKPARSVVLVGQAGAANWEHFQRWLSGTTAKPANPLDSWSREVIGTVADEVLARAVFPSDKPWLPFQQWAVRAEGLKPSPLGILIHPDYGLWHAYRGALLFDDLLELEATATARPHPCDSCVEKPCLTACPVNAFLPDGFDSAACVGHVAGIGGAECRNVGCLARNACPIGKKYRYPAKVQAFHMAAFLANNPAK